MDPILFLGGAMVVVAPICQLSGTYRESQFILASSSTMTPNWIGTLV